MGRSKVRGGEGGEGEGGRGRGEREEGRMTLSTYLVYMKYSTNTVSCENCRGQ